MHLSITKQTEVVQLAQVAHIEILLLQETNFRSSSEVFAFKQCFHLKCFFSSATSPFCGVGIIVFRHELMHNSHFEHEADGRVICLDTDIRDKKIHLVNVYAPAARDKLNRFYTDLDAYLLATEELIIGGDFNCVLNTSRDTRSLTPGCSTL